jgi:hypothetical protein
MHPHRVLMAGCDRLVGSRALAGQLNGASVGLGESRSFNLPTYHY